MGKNATALRAFKLDGAPIKKGRVFLGMADNQFDDLVLINFVRASTDAEIAKAGGPPVPPPVTAKAPRKPRKS
jgi:hypothetical protein